MFDMFCVDVNIHIDIVQYIYAASILSKIYSSWNNQTDKLNLSIKEFTFQFKANGTNIKLRKYDSNPNGH